MSNHYHLLLKTMDANSKAMQWFGTSFTRKFNLNNHTRGHLLIYLLWKTERLSNKEIGACFGLTYSAISRRVKVMNDRVSVEQKLRDQYQILKSQIKIRIPASFLILRFFQAGLS